MLTAFHTTTFMTSDERRRASGLPKIERKEMIEHLLITYPTFDGMLHFIRKFNYPAGDDAGHGTGAIGGMLGNTGVGKSDICKFYCNQWQPLTTPDGMQYPVVYLDATNKTTPTTLCDRVFKATGALSTPGRIKGDAYVTRTVERLVKLGCRLFILDDAQFILLDRNRNQSGLFYSFLKELVDTERVNILLVGDVSIEEYMVANPPLQRRGDFPHADLAPLRDEGDEFEQFRLLLRKIDNRLPFAESSLLDSREFAEDLHLFSQGALGRVMNLIRYAGYQALDENTSHITREHLMIQANLRRRPRDTYRYFERVPTPTKRGLRGSIGGAEQ